MPNWQPCFINSEAVVCFIPLSHLEVRLMAGEQGLLRPDQLSLRHRGGMETAENVHGSCQCFSDLGGRGGHMDHKVARPQAVKLAELKGDVIGQAK